MELLGYAVALMAFLTLYALLYARAQRRGQQPRVQWPWLAAIVLCALAAVALGALL